MLQFQWDINMQYNYGNISIFDESLPTIPKVHPNFLGILCFCLIMFISKTCSIYSIILAL